VEALEAAVFTGLSAGFVAALGAGLLGPEASNERLPIGTDGAAHTSLGSRREHYLSVHSIRRAIRAGALGPGSVIHRRCLTFACRRRVRPRRRRRERIAQTLSNRYRARLCVGRAGVRCEQGKRRGAGGGDRVRAPVGLDLDIEEGFGKEIDERAAAHEVAEVRALLELALSAETECGVLEAWARVSALWAARADCGAHRSL
jgi:hypothetical protein